MSVPDIDQPQTKMGCFILVILIFGSMTFAYIAVRVVQAF